MFEGPARGRPLPIAHAGFGVRGPFHADWDILPICVRKAPG